MSITLSGREATRIDKTMYKTMYLLRASSAYRGVAAHGAPRGGIRS
jgi:hypothetical protein